MKNSKNYIKRINDKKRTIERNKKRKEKKFLYSVA